MYTISIPLGSYLLVDLRVRDLLVSYRQVVIVGLVLGAALLRYQAISAKRPVLFGLAFAVWYATVATISDRLSVGVFVVYVSWALVVFGLMPVLGARGQLGLFLKVVAWLGSATVVFTSLLWVGGGNPYGASHLGRLRWSLGYENPNILAALVQLAVLATIWRGLLGLVNRLWMWPPAFAGALVAYLAGSSNYFAFWFGFVLAFIALGTISLRQVAVGTATGGLVLLSVLLATENLLRFNASTSGRLFIWRDTLTTVYSGSLADQFFTTFTGTATSFVGADNVYGEATGRFAGQRVGVDNTYLGTFVETGIVGLALLIAAWIYLLRGLTFCSQPTLARLAGATAIGFAMQASVVSSISSFGNVATLGISCMLALASGAGQRECSGLATKAREDRLSPIAACDAARVSSRDRGQGALR